MATVADAYVIRRRPTIVMASDVTNDSVTANDKSGKIGVPVFCIIFFGYVLLCACMKEVMPLLAIFLSSLL